MAPPTSDDDQLVLSHAGGVAVAARLRMLHNFNVACDLNIYISIEMAEPTRRSGLSRRAEDHEWGLGIFACRLTGDPPLTRSPVRAPTGETLIWEGGRVEYEY